MIILNTLFTLLLAATSPTVLNTTGVTGAVGSAPTPTPTPDAVYVKQNPSRGNTRNG